MGSVVDSHRRSSRLTRGPQLRVGEIVVPAVVALVLDVPVLVALAAACIGSAAVQQPPEQTQLLSPAWSADPPTRLFHCAANKGQRQSRRRDQPQLSPGFFVFLVRVHRSVTSRPYSHLLRFSACHITDNKSVTDTPVVGRAA